MSELWKECLACQDKCCNHDIASRIFVTPDEFERMRKTYPDKVKLFNSTIPCPFLTEEQLCLVHRIKPADCRLFPFDLIMMDGKFLWIVREFNCSIAQSEGNFEEYLISFEENIIPDFIPFMADYALFRFDELAKKYGFRILREVRMEEI